MSLSLKRAFAGVVGLAAASTLVPLAMASPASAAPSLQGAASIKTPGGGAPLTSGDTSTNFTLRLPAGAACGGDASAGYRVEGYMVSSAIDPATIDWTGGGPQPPQFGGPQSTFRQPLYDTTGTPYLGFPAAATPPSTSGAIINIPDFTYTVFDAAAIGDPNVVPEGVYNIGIACILSDATEEYWNTTVTFTANAGDGFANRDWAQGAVAAAPTLDSVTPGNGTVTANFTPGLSDPAATSYTATATGPGGPFTASGSGSPLTITGLTNGTAYDVTVTATNSVGTSAPSNAVSATPIAGARTNVTNVSVTPGGSGSGDATVNWTEPGPNDPPASPVSYTVDVAGPTPSTNSVPAPATSFALTGLAVGSYTVTVTANYADAPTTGTVPASTPVAFAINPAQVLLQDIDVTRPVGALVLTQVCGVHGTIPADAASPGFPGGLPELPAVDSSSVEAPTAGGTTPTLTEDGTDADPLRPDYPYPTDGSGVANPNYPTHCGVDLGVAQFVRRGQGAGQFFATSGILSQVTVVDTRDDDAGWSVTGAMGRFAASLGTDSFSGSQLGWIPTVTEDTGPFVDSDGNPYDQVVTPGDAVGPNAANAVGLSSGRTLATAAPNEGLGTAILDARLKLLIPVTADSGNYRGTLTITAT